MVLRVLLIFLFLIPSILSSQDTRRSTDQFLQLLDDKIPQLLQEFSVPGAAIAIIEDGQIVLQKGYGYANLEKGRMITTKTGFNIGSISKSVAAWGVMKLVQEGKIELDAPVEKYLTRWHLPESEFDTDEVTIRRLLSHTAGLSLHCVSAGPPYDKLPTLEGWLLGQNDGLGKVEIVLEPGSRYKYSGGGYGVLQLLIEEVTGQSFEHFMQTHILNPLGMIHSSYLIDSTMMAASATPYDTYGEVTDFELFTVQAGAGLHTTLEDLTQYALASLFRHRDQNEFNPVLSNDRIEQMMQPVLEGKGRWKYGMGYQTEFIGSSFVFSGHSGANDGWQANFRVDPFSDSGFVVLTNGGSGYGICNQIMCDWVFWKTGESLGSWCQLKVPISNKMKQIIDKIGINHLSEKYRELKENHPDHFDFSESQLNNLGYYYMGKGELEKALSVFQLNVEAFPYAYNVYDSYGEALLEAGERKQAINNYKKSVSLNPENTNGIDVLKQLGESTEDLVYKVPYEHLKSLEGEYLATHDEDWKVLVQVEEEILKCEDKYYNFVLVPIGHNKFVNPRFGALWRFNTTGPRAKPVLQFGKFKFLKVK